MSDRITQLAVETLIEVDAAKPRLTQLPVEVLASSTGTKARLTQLVIEVLILEGTAPSGRKYGPAIQM